MSRPDRWWRKQRQEQWNRRPSRVSMSSLPRRQRFTKDSMDHVAEVSMDAGVMMGRRFGERDLYQALQEMCDDPAALAEWVRKQAGGDELDDVALVERLRQRDPEALHRLAEAIRAGDDLLDVADAAGVLADSEDKALWDSVPPAGESVVVEIEQWLRERDRWIENFREHGELPGDEDTE